MTELLPVAVGLSAAAGAVLRHAVSVRLTRRALNAGFPWSTWLVNCLGAALFGLSLHALAHRHESSLWLEMCMGFCGGFTTLSAWSVESVGMFRRNRRQALGYSVSTVVVGMGVLLLAWQFG